MQRKKFEIGARVRLLATYPNRYGPVGGFPERVGTVINAWGMIPSTDVSWDHLTTGWETNEGSKGKSGWCVENIHLVLNKTTPTVATDLRLKPQAKTVLRHLRKKGHISPAEALIVYSISRLAACVYELRKAGYEISKTMKHDAQGHGYAQYALTVH